MTPVTLPCPRCRAATAVPDAGAGPVTACPACGLQMSTAYLQEAADLATWHTWAGRRLAWLNDRLLAGDQPAAGPAPGPSQAASRMAPESAAPTTAAGPVLLAIGAFLLVVAAIGFLAFTWDLLGPFGQISVLLLLGVVCLTVAGRLAGRLQGTATALGVVGAFLVVIAAIGTRTLGPDLIGATAALLLALVVSVALGAVAVHLRPRLPAVGELSGVAGSLATVTLLASAPADDAIAVGDSWPWWVAGVCLGAGAAMVLTSDRVRLDSWEWVGAWFLLVGTVAAAAAVLDLVSGSVAPAGEAAVVSATLTVTTALVVVTLVRSQPRRASVVTAALTTWSLALAIAWSSALSTPSARPWSALALALGGLLGIATAVRMHAVWLRWAVGVAAVSALGAALGASLAPWVDPWDDHSSVAAWADAGWPPWRGVVAGLAVVAVLVASAVVLRRRDHSLEILALVPGAAALVTWLAASTNDLGEVGAEAPDPVAHQIAIALAVVSAGLLALALLRLLPSWTVWPAVVLGATAGLTELSTREVHDSFRPEVLGVALALPTLAAAVGWWWLRRPRPTPTGQTVAPALSLLLLPPTLSLFADSADQWWSDAAPSTAYQVRMVSLLVVGVLMTVVGAWGRWAGLFYPGVVVTLAIAVIELAELGRFLPQWVSFTIGGLVLLAAGARWEWLRDRGREGTTWMRSLT